MRRQKISGHKKRTRSLAILGILGLCITAPSGILGQRAVKDPVFNAGIKGGMNLSDLVRPEPIEGWSGKSGLIAGGFVTLRFNDILSIQPEFLFSEKGAIWTGLYQDHDSVATANILYLDIPVLWKFYVPMKPTALIRPNLFLGPCWSFKLNATNAIVWNDVVQQKSDISGLADQDFSLVFGGGIDISAAIGKISFDVRFGTSYGNISLAERTKNRVISIVAGYAFF